MELTKALNKVRIHTPYKINFKDKSCRIGNKEYVKDGICEIECELSKDLKTDLENLYREFKNSIPGFASQGKSRKSYFKAIDDMNCFTDEMLINGGDRELKRFELEFFVLINIALNKEFKWSDLTDENHYFYQGIDKGLVILKSWF